MDWMSVIAMRVLSHHVWIIKFPNYLITPINKFRMKISIIQNWEKHQ